MNGYIHKYLRDVEKANIKVFVCVAHPELTLENIVILV